MSNCAGCKPNDECGGTSCDCYTPTDHVHAVSSRDAVRYEVPPTPRIILLWRGTEGRRVRCNAHERGIVKAVRERDRMLAVELDTGIGAGHTYLYPMRTTVLVDEEA